MLPCVLLSCLRLAALLKHVLTLHHCPCASCCSAECDDTALLAIPPLCCPLQEIEAVRAKQRRQGIMAGLQPAAGAAAAAGLQRLPQHSPGLEQQLRASQQQQQQGALPVSSSPTPTPAAPAAAAAPIGRGRGGGIFALAHVPSTAAAGAMAAAEEGGAPASFDGWGGAGES